MDHEFFMRQAIDMAKKAAAIHEVPIGCVIVYDGTVIGRGYNQRVTKKNVLYHAEILAINEACRYLNDWRLENCSLYVTIEPCPMCAGALIQSRIKEVIFGARNKKAGCAGSILNILEEPAFNHQVIVTEDILRDECAALMTDYFSALRKSRSRGD